MITLIRMAGLMVGLLWPAVPLVGIFWLGLQLL